MSYIKSRHNNTLSKHIFPYMEEPNGRKSVLIFSHFVYINPTYSNNSLKIVSNKLRYRS